MKAVVASTRLGSASCHGSHDSSKPSQNESPSQECDLEEKVGGEIEATNLTEPQKAGLPSAASEEES